MKIVMGSDHAAYELRTKLVARLEADGYHIVDLGTDSPASTDYPIWGAKVGSAVVAGEGDLGIAICGSGVGISIAAN